MMIRVGFVLWVLSVIISKPFLRFVVPQTFHLKPTISKDRQGGESEKSVAGSTIGIGDMYLKNVLQAEVAS